MRILSSRLLLPLTVASCLAVTAQAQLVLNVDTTTEQMFLAALLQQGVL